MYCMCHNCLLYSISRDNQRLHDIHTPQDDVAGEINGEATSTLKHLFYLLLEGEKETQERPDRKKKIIGGG